MNTKYTYISTNTWLATEYIAGNPVGTYTVTENFPGYYPAGETITAGNSVMLVGEKIFKNNYTVPANYNKFLGFANESGVLNDRIEVTARGDCNQFAGLTIGAIYYNSLTVIGGITTVAPTAFPQIVGIAKAPGILTVNWVDGINPAAVVLSSYTLAAKTASDISTGANVTPVILTGLVFAYAANSTYRINIYGAISAPAATTGCGFQLDLSSAVTSVWLTFYHQLANAGTLTGGNSVADNVSQGVSSGIPANAGIYPVMGGGLLITTVNAGTAQLMFRSETTAVATCKAGTTLVVEKII